MCHHSGFNKVSIEKNKKGRSKNTECKAQIDIKIKLSTRDTKKKDKYIRVSYISFTHPICPVIKK